MNTVTLLFPSALPAHRRRATAKRLLVVAGLSLALPLLAACSSDRGSGGDPNGSNASEGATTAPTESATNFATPTAEANGDPFCDLAVEAQAGALAAQEFTANFGPVFSGVASGSAPISDLNAWGTELGEHTQRALDFYAAAGPYVEGTDGEAPFTALESFTRDYSLTLATMAASATDSGAFLNEFATFSGDDSLRNTILLGPAASAEVAAYITDRCPAVG